MPEPRSSPGSPVTTGPTAVKKVLLHIGTGKTGTTSIQHTLDRAAGQGRLGRVAYPHLRGKDHNFIAALYRPYGKLPRIYKSAYGPDPTPEFEADVATFREGLWDVVDRNDRVIISGEYMTAFQPEDARALRDDLHRHGVTEVLVVMYVRDPASYYLSWLQQRVKAASRFEPPAAWRDRSFEAVRVWRNTFSELRVRPFDRRLLDGGDAVCDFLGVASDFFGGDLRNAGIEVLTRNESISAEGMVLMHRYRDQFYPEEQNIFKPDSSGIHSVLQRSKAILPQTTPRLRYEVAQMVLRNHAIELEALWDDYGIDFRPDPAAGDGCATVEGARLADLADVLEPHDEEVLDRLVLHALRHGFSSQPDLIRRPPADATPGRRRETPG